MTPAAEVGPRRRADPCIAPADWLLVSLLGVYLVFVVGGFPGIYQVQWRLVTHVLTLVLIVGWLARHPLAPGPLRPAATDAADRRRPRRHGRQHHRQPVSALRLGDGRQRRRDRARLRGAGHDARPAGPAATAPVHGGGAGRRRRRRLRHPDPAGCWADFWSLVGHLVVPPLRPAFAGLVVRHAEHPGRGRGRLPAAGRWHGSRARSLATTARRVAHRGARRRSGSSISSPAARAGRSSASPSRWSSAPSWWPSDDRRRCTDSADGSRRPARALASSAIGAMVVVAAAIVAQPGHPGRAGDAGVGLRLTFWQHSLARLRRCTR